jgi:hypothetical protein
MSSDDGMRIVGTIRTIELHGLGAKFQGVVPRQVARICLDIERALDGSGDEISVENLNGLHFHGPPELVPLYTAGDRVQIVTSNGSGMQIASIRRAPLS